MFVTINGSLGAFLCVNKTFRFGEWGSNQGTLLTGVLELMQVSTPDKNELNKLLCFVCNTLNFPPAQVRSLFESTDMWERSWFLYSETFCHNLGTYVASQSTDLTYELSLIGPLCF